MFSRVYLFLHLFSFVHPNLLVFTYIDSFYLFIRVYLCLALFTIACLFV